VLSLLAFPILAAALVGIYFYTSLCDQIITDNVKTPLAVLVALPLIQVGLGYYWVIERLAFGLIVVDRKVGDFAYRQLVKFFLWRRRVK
jgi:hypothetical protein